MTMKKSKKHQMHWNFDLMLS